MLEQDTTSLKKASITAVAPTDNLANSSKQNQEICRNDKSNASFNEEVCKGNCGDAVVIKINGEKHWVSGIDSHTTCTSLIQALLLYQDLERNRCKFRNGHSYTYNIRNDHLSTTNTKDDKETFFMEGLKNSHEYVIVKQLRDGNFEEYLDGSTRLLDVIPIRTTSKKKQYELQLRHLSPQIYSEKQNHMLSMLSMSTDKDSGMGSPVCSSRSERYRRRRGKQRTGMASVTAMAFYRGCPALPKRSHHHHHHQQPQQQPLKHCNANPNERLMNIILAQDETINRQIYLLNQKEQQILKIENEKHRVRELKIGKNYMLDAYLNALDKTPDKALALTTQNHNDQRKGELILNGEKPHSARTLSGERKWLETTNSTVAEPNLSSDMDMYWLEKVYALNILLQREEEQLLRLYAKVRKHQMRSAYLTKDEVLQQIDRLDMVLANQVVDIYRVERQLLTANEQLKAKLGVLESLGDELEVLPLENLDTGKNATASLTDHNFKINEDLMGYRESRQNDTPNADEENYMKKPSQNVVERNSNVWDHTDVKLLKKQMFFTVENHDKLTDNTWCNQNCIKKPQPISTCKSSPETDMIFTSTEVDFDLQHPGTLV